MPTKRPARMHGIAAVVVGLVLVAGCGSSNDSDGTLAADPTFVEASTTGSSNPSVGEETTTTTSSPTAITVPAYVYTRTWTTEAVAVDGLRWTMTFEAGELFVPEADGLYAGCSFDAERDAVIPIRLGYERADDGFTGDVFSSVAVISYDGRYGRPFDLGDPSRAFEIGLALSDGDQCEQPYGVNGDGIIRARWNNVASGSSRTGEAGTSGFLVLKNYRTPAAPDGSPDFVDRMWLQFSYALAGGSYELSGTTGPGVTSVQITTGQYDIFPLDGAT